MVNNERSCTKYTCKLRTDCPFISEHLLHSEGNNRAGHKQPHFAMAHRLLWISSNGDSGFCPPTWA